MNHLKRSHIYHRDWLFDQYLETLDSLEKWQSGELKIKSAAPNRETKRRKDFVFHLKQELIRLNIELLKYDKMICPPPDSPTRLSVEQQLLQVV